MTELSEIRAKYDGKSIEEIERMALESQGTSVEARREFIEALYYLRENGRFRENPKFKDATFATYIHSRFMMSVSQFDRERVAYINFPDATERFGPGVVSKAVKKLGQPGARKVFNSLGKAKTVRAVDVAIDKHAVKLNPPKKGEPEQPIDRYEVREVIRDKDKVIAEQEQQIAKLKRTVVQLKSELAQKEIELQRYRQMLGVGTEAVCVTQKEIMA